MDEHRPNGSDATMDPEGQPDCAESIDKEKFEAGKDPVPVSLEDSGGGKVAGNDAPVVELGLPDDQDGRKEERPRPSFEGVRSQPTFQNQEMFENQEIFEPACLKISQLWEPSNFEDKSSKSTPFQVIQDPRYLPQLHTSQQDRNKYSTDIQEVEEMNECAGESVAAKFVGGRGI